ncbi:uncharacterized protein LOC144116125 isoform X2 [Amblyomma americanum]
MFLRCWNECALGSVFQYWFCTKPSDYDVVVFQGAWSKDSDAGVVLSRGWLNTALSTVFMTSAFSSLLAMTAGSVIQFQVCQDATYVISRREARERRDTCGIGGSPVCTVTPPVWRWFWVRTRSNFSSATTRFLDECDPNIFKVSKCNICFCICYTCVKGFDVGNFCSTFETMKWLFSGAGQAGDVSQKVD